MRIAVVRRRDLGSRLRPPAPRRPRPHRLRGQRLRGRPQPHGPRGHRRRDAPRGHGLHRPQRPQLPALRAAARERGRCHAAGSDELLRERRSRRARVQRLLGKRVVRESREPGESLLPPDGPRPPPLQPRGPGARGAERERAEPRAVPRRGRLLARLRRPAARAAGLGRVVGGPGVHVGLPRQPARGVLRQPRHVRLQRPPALARGQRRLGALRRAADPRLRTQPAALIRRCAASSDSTT